MRQASWGPRARRPRWTALVIVLLLMTTACSTTLARQQTNSVTIFWIPFERKTVGSYHVEIDCNWLVVDNDVLLGE